MHNYVFPDATKKFTLQLKNVFLRKLLLTLTTIEIIFYTNHLEKESKYHGRINNQSLLIVIFFKKLIYIVEDIYFGAYLVFGWRV